MVSFKLSNVSRNITHPDPVLNGDFADFRIVSSCSGNNFNNLEYFETSVKIHIIIFNYVIPIPTWYNNYVIN